MKLPQILLLSLSGLVACGVSPADDDTGWYEGFLETTGWAVTDRVGLPAVNTFFIDTDTVKDEFNESDDSATALATFRALVKSKGETVRAGVVAYFATEDGGDDEVTVDELAVLAVPDVLTLDLSATDKFPNGRRLDDDAIDEMLGLTLNRGKVLSGGTGIADGVSNDSTFLDEFPFIGEPLE